MAAVLVLVLIIRFVPRYGQKHMVIYIGICSLMGSLTVIFAKVSHPNRVSNINNNRPIIANLSSSTGYERESCGNRLKAVIFRNESIYLCSDLVFLSCCRYLLSRATELLKQGN